MLKAKLTLLCLFVGLILFAQKKPVKPDAEAQMKEAMKALDELEKQDPEAAKTARAMLQQRMPAKTVTKQVPPKPFVSPVVAPATSRPAKNPTPAESKDHLLWYRGKKLTANSLITPSGTLVQIDPAKNRIAVQPDPSKDPFTKLVKELSRSEQRKDQLTSQLAASKNSFFFYPSIIRTLEEIDQVNKSYAEVSKNTINLPSRLSKPSGNSGKQFSLLTSRFLGQSIDPRVTVTYNEVIAAMANPPSLDFPPPPTRANDLCFACNEEGGKDYANKVHEWDSIFFSFETTTGGKALSVLRELTDVPGDSASKMTAEMGKVNEFLFERLDKKADMLFAQFEKDYERLPSVVQMLLAIERQKQLMGVNSDNGGYANLMERLQSIFDGFDKYLDKQMELKNYNVVFNFPFILGMERQKQLVGTSEDNGMQYWLKAMDFNRFRLSMNMEFDLAFLNSEGEEELKATGRMATSGNVYVSLGMIGCKYQMFLTNTSYGEGDEVDYRIPLTISGGTKSVKDENDRWVTYPYSGPKEMQAVFPAFHISFCDDGVKDSAWMEIVKYKIEDLSPYAQAVRKSYSVDFLAYANNLFMTVSQVEGTSGQAEAAAKEMMTAFSAPSAPETSTGNPKLDKLQADYNLVVKMAEYQNKISQLSLMQKTLFLFDAKNNDDVLIDAETNTAHKDQQVNLKKGLINIKVVHDPKQ